ncbi:MAG: DUF2721 domain-containing protein [Candidatus Omnitrophica bacterium]|nr:DUF2721 domain-containing protein [Candidatus Omnitrophota bacterium]
MVMTNAQLTQIMQSSVAPCVLISGAGLLLLVLAGRLARPIDRVRHLCDLVKKHPGPEGESYRQQIDIFYKRCHLLRNSVATNVICLSAIATVILLLFLSNLFNVSLITPITVCFIVGVLALILSLLFFLNDLFMTLKSLEIEIRDSCN